MIQLLILAVLNALFCNGLYNSFQFEHSRVSEGGKLTVDDDTKSVFWWFKFYFLDKIPHRISKPFGNCLTCMASVYSFVPFWWCFNFDFTNFETLILYPFYILVLAGLNNFIDKLSNGGF